MFRGTMDGLLCGEQGNGHPFLCSKVTYGTIPHADDSSILTDVDIDVRSADFETLPSLSQIDVGRSIVGVGGLVLDDKVIEIGG